jgi:hypothetical protein
MAVSIAKREPLLLARQCWRSSGITDEQAERLGFKPLGPRQTADLSPGFHAVHSLQIPYMGFDGRPTGFYRIRYLEPLPGFAGLVEKPQRYAQSPGTLNEIYLPNVLDWEEIRKNKNEQICITEGERKAASACVNNLAAIGLGGVDVWKAAKRGIALLPQLTKFEWSGRSVVICFDSDAAEKVEVVRAQINLSRELLALGAIVTIASLPAGPDNKKQGLDDFIVAHGVDALNEILEQAPGLPESQALWAMNAELAYIRSPGMVAVRDTGTLMETGKFEREIYANRHYVEITVSGGKDPKTVSKKKPLAPRWIEWEQRFELNKVIYAPGQPTISNNSYNVWKGWGTLPKKGSIKPWKDLLDFIFRSDPGQRKWFEQWCAYPIQYPGTKLYTAALLWGATKGTGKTLVAYCLGKIYGVNFVEIKSKDLKRDFNAWQEHRQFVYADEITGGQARTDADYLKGLITQHTLKINQKYMPEYIIDDCINYLFASNHADAMFLEDGDRRFFVHEVIGPAMPTTFYDTIDKWLKSPEGPAALFHHLLHIDLEGFHPREHAPVTLAKQAMILASKGELAYWVQQMLEDPPGVFKGVYSERARSNMDLWTPRLLLRACDPDGRKRATEASLGRALTAAGIRQVNGGVPIRTRYGVVRLYAIRNPDMWAKASPKACSEHYESFIDDLTKF